MTPASGTARAKLLLFGEHAAVYGHPALGLALPWTLTARLLPGPDWDLEALGPHRDGVRALVARLGALGEAAGLRPPVPGRLWLDSQVPLGCGFGSSGALCAALVNLFWPGLPLADRDLLAWKAEAQFHGTPSGIDTALALREGWWALDTGTKPPAARPLAVPALVLVAGALVRTEDTRTLVARLARRREAGDPSVDRTLDDLGALASEAVAAVGQARADRIPPLVNRAREGLRSLDLEPPALSAVLDGAVLRTGALAGKLSGAGGGGAFFLVYPDTGTARAALPALEGLVPETLWTRKPALI